MLVRVDRGVRDITAEDPPFFMVGVSGDSCCDTGGVKATGAGGPASSTMSPTIR